MRPEERTSKFCYLYFDFIDCMNIYGNHKMYKINLTCVFSLLRRTVYIGFTPFRIFRYLSQKCIPNQNQYRFCTKQEVVVFHGKIAWKPYHTKKNSRLCSIYYTINWNFIICAAIVSWKTWLPLLILNNFFLFLISKFGRPRTTQCGVEMMSKLKTSRQNFSECNLV